MQTMEIIAQCSGCGNQTTDRRALTCCKGYCQDASGKSCDALQCPICGHVHFWTGSVGAPTNIHKLRKTIVAVQTAIEELTANA